MLPGSPIGLIAGVVMVAGFFIAYRKFIYSPKKKAGEAFLAARPITIFAKKK
jgi:cbb3-type cytochrome oxidase subunit 3